MGAAHSEVHALVERLHAAADDFERDFDDPYRRGVAHQRMRDLVDEIDDVVHGLDRGPAIDLRDGEAPGEVPSDQARVAHERER